MAQSIEEFLKAGEGRTIGTVGPKTKIAPVVTREGKPIYITLAKTPTLTTAWLRWPSYDGGERTSLDLRITGELEQLAEETAQEQQALAFVFHRSCV